MQVLRDLKERFHARSYDETVMRLVSKSVDIPLSKFGSRPKMKPFMGDDRGAFHEL